ncbi:MAG TPA: VOC family protein [Puia sp.]|jgi:predicted 3-demethylubiquinone-9 3-methyltransferase (glyoxalase superfamily)|nr:VOC family protein [Puia sp.]
MQKIVPFLWYKDNKAEEAANFYVGIVRGAKITEVLRSGSTGPGPAGSVVTVSFTIGDQEIVALNGNPQFDFSMASSLMIHCDTQDEIDEYWEKLSAGGQKIQCGWLTDKYGVAWQIAPPVLRKMLGDKDPQKAARVMQAMMKMTKIEIEPLRRAYEG